MTALATTLWTTTSGSGAAAHRTAAASGLRRQRAWIHGVPAIAAALAKEQSA